MVVTVGVESQHRAPNFFFSQLCAAMSSVPQFPKQDWPTSLHLSHTCNRTPARWDGICSFPVLLINQAAAAGGVMQGPSCVIQGDFLILHVPVPPFWMLMLASKGLRLSADTTQIRLALPSARDRHPHQINLLWGKTTTTCNMRSQFCDKQLNSEGLDS